MNGEIDELKNIVLENKKISKKDEFVLIKIYQDLLEQYKNNKNNKQLYENIKLLEKYIYS